MAAQSIHAKITALMHKALQQSLGEQERLQDDESLSINIDCMDACGKCVLQLATVRLASCLRPSIVDVLHFLCICVSGCVRVCGLIQSDRLA